MWVSSSRFWGGRAALRGTTRHGAPAQRGRAITTAIAALLTAGLLIAAYLAYRGSPVAAAPHEPVSIALSTTPHASLLHLASAKGYLADEGLDVTIVPATHGKAAMDLLSQGRANLASAAEVPFVISVMQGERFGIAATLASVSSEMAVVARRDRGITAPRDLARKKVGVTLGTSGEYFLWAFLIRYQLPTDSVTLVNVPPNRMAQELAAGTIDAAAMWQPLVVQAQVALGSNGLLFTEASAYTVTHVLVGHIDYLKAHAPAMQKLVRALLKAEQFNREEPEQALALVASWLKIDAPTLKPSLKELDFGIDLQQSQLITLEDEARWAMARGYAPPGPVPNFLPNLYLDALLAVRPERVSVVR